MSRVYKIIKNKKTNGAIRLDEENTEKINKLVESTGLEADVIVNTILRTVTDESSKRALAILFKIKVKESKKQAKEKKLALRPTAYKKMDEYLIAERIVNEL